MEALLSLDDTTLMMELQQYDDWADMPMVAHFQAWSTPGGRELVPSPSSEDAGGILLDWTCGSAASSPQLVLQSPTCDVLQESIWSETADEFPRAEWFADIGRKRRHLSSDDDLNKLVSPHEVILCSSDVLIHSADDSLLDDVDINNIEPESVLQNSNIGCVAYESDQILVSSFPVKRDVDSSGRRAGDMSSFDSHSSVTRSSVTYTLTESLQCLNDVDVLQQVPSSPGVSFELVDLDCESLRDPESVFRILRGLSAGSGGLAALVEAFTAQPALSPVSAEEVESILSDGMEFCEDVADLLSTTVDDSSSVVMDEDAPQHAVSPYSQSSLQSTHLSSTVDEQLLQRPISPQSSCGSSVYSRAVPAMKRQKKKEQNKTAALRYRRKKREEKGVVLSEVDQLELRNNELKSRVEDLNREISYLRGLINEINQQ